MSNKDYVAIAETLKNRKESEFGLRPEFTSLVESVLRVVVNDLALVFKQGNSSFDADKFRVACGFGDPGQIRDH